VCNYCACSAKSMISAPIVWAIGRRGVGRRRLADRYRHLPSWATLVEVSYREETRQWGEPPRPPPGRESTKDAHIFRFCSLLVPNLSRVEQRRGSGGGARRGQASAPVVMARHPPKQACFGWNSDPDPDAHR
jgi:hypothetical protein